ncbi:hypothetical protein MADA3029_900103 [Vibrio nigripulchritudo MADA3029]|nr:hypothetical protein VIBNIAM115_1190040 [Vibrio nigripulchritudo AM115]CCN42295.1 hypothetical protein VIBNIFTn2_280063 [Vibrio nigripulchritudo FTn2]CCN45346.1 hypothetical protein VIBNIMADA3020_1040066 [Vibrio nigripulchritudo MADA3020]CCN51794.1 hypothetical protein VIBNIMADA3021_1160102 [Vibrio nigripulchritudo MADA3021]CCN61958.1 hypothetical protein MADA3029_900103 [Vibrio nigripulchritudo MADA3029]CCN65920.1 hypothetical protein VIBNIPon4_470063 [Vibrio nigripulchritudo POn4]CCN7580
MIIYNKNFHLTPDKTILTDIMAEIVRHLSIWNVSVCQRAYA